MSDQLSKVVEARQIIDEFIQCSNVGRSDGKLVSAAKDWLAATDRIESAAAPVEVGDEANENALYVEHCAEKLCEAGARVKGNTLAGIATYIRTLARQLAEAKEQAEFQQAITKELLPYQERAAKAESALAAATRRVAEVKGLVGKWEDRAGELDELGDYDGANLVGDCARELESATTPAEVEGEVDPPAKPRYNCPTEAHDGEE